MASMMGRSCGYGVHLRSCLPSVSLSPVSSNSLASLSRLASCFFLRFSSSSCRNRRLKLCTAPPSSSRRHVLFVHGEADQEGSSARSAFGLRQSHATKRALSQKKKVEGGVEIDPILGDAQTVHAVLVEDTSLSLSLAVTSVKKVTRRKKVDNEIPLQTSEDSLPGDVKAGTPKRASPRKKTVAPDVSSIDTECVLAEKKVNRRKKVDSEIPLQASEESLPGVVKAGSSKRASPRKKMEAPEVCSLDMESVLVEKRVTRRKKVDSEIPLQASEDSLPGDDAKAGTSKRASRRKKMVASDVSSLDMESVLAEETAPSKSPRRKKRSSSADLEEKVGAVIPDGAASFITSSLSQLSSPDAVLATPKKATRKKKTTRSDSPSAESTVSVGRKRTVPQDKKTSVEEGKDVTSEDRATIPTLTVKTVLSSLLPEEEHSAFAGSTIETLQEIQAGTQMNKVPQDKKTSVEEGNNVTSEDRATIPTPTVKIVSSSLSPAEEGTSASAGRAIETLQESQTETQMKYKYVNSEPETYRKKEFISHANRANNSRDTFGAHHKQMVSGRNVSPPKWTERADPVKMFPTTGERWSPNKHGNTDRTFGRSPQSKEDVRRQQWATWKKSDTTVKDGAAGAVVQRSGSSSSMQFATTGRKETYSQGYNLANIDRAYGMERKKRKEFTLRNVVANQASTISYMQIFGTGFDTGDTVPTVLLFFDRRRFLFNVGEGLHRFCMEHRFKLSKIDHVFLTRVCSETAGGLPGLILTLSDIGETGLTVKTWGPSSLQDLAQAMHTFVPSGWMEHTHSFGPGEDNCACSESSSSLPILLLEDELIRISAVLLYSEKTPHSTAESVSPEERKGDVMSTVYICELSTVRGKFDPDKALAKGLRPGYKYGKLQRGESVMSDDGTTMVHPEDVLGPSSPGPIMFLVDCPSSSYISSLTSSASLQSYFSQTGKVVNCMIHIGPTSVTRSIDYQSWMENFRETHHIMARRELKVLGTPTLKYSAKIISKLNLVCPQLFPIVEADTEVQKEAASDLMVDGENLLKYHFRPLSDLGLDGSDIPEAFNRAAAQKKWRRESAEVMRAREMAGQVFKTWSEVKPHHPRWETKGRDGFTGSKDCQDLPACLQHVSREEMELVFLGTGSSQPAKHRNVTGIYIHLFEKGGILLDCGEGTYAQLKRRYGAKGADDVLMGLKCIWISHMHADHFTGLARILSARRQLLQTQPASEPILLIGPRRLKLFLDAYGKVEDLVMEFLDCSQTTLEVQSWANKENAEVRGGMEVQRKEGLIRASSEGGSGKSGMQYFWKQPGFHAQQGIDIAGRESLRRVLNLLGLKDLYSVPVVHCPQAFAVVLEAQGRKISESETKPGWKLVFSGDTRPCQALVEAARGATILIHEATFDDDLIAEAVKKNHSMTKEAIEVGVAAQVYRIFLTHFSQRYPTIPLFDNRYSDRTCIAFDMMSVNLADLPIVPKFVPALQLLFRDQTDAEEDLVVTV